MRDRITNKYHPFSTNRRGNESADVKNAGIFNLGFFFLKIFPSELGSLKFLKNILQSQDWTSTQQQWTRYTTTGTLIGPGGSSKPYIHMANATKYCKKTQTFGRYRLLRIVLNICAFFHGRGKPFHIISLHLTQTLFTFLKYKENLPVLISWDESNLKCIVRNNEGFIFSLFCIQLTRFPDP